VPPPKKWRRCERWITCAAMRQAAVFLAAVPDREPIETDRIPE
jgi:hypothetical protein